MRMIPEACTHYKSATVTLFRPETRSSCIIKPSSFKMPIQNVKLAVLGSAGVGKSAMVVRYITGRFLHHYDPTLEDEYCIETEVEGQLVNVNILDTAGIGESSCDCSNYLSLVDAVLVVFSLENQSSLTTARQLLESVRTSSLPAVLIGTKCDLRSNERILSYDEALTFANKYGCTYVETSSAVNINIFEAFQSAISAVVMKKPADEEAVKVVKIEKKNSTRRKVRSIWSRLTRFRKDKKLLDSLVASPNSIEVDIIRLCSAH